MAERVAVLPAPSRTEVPVVVPLRPEGDRPNIDQPTIHLTPEEQAEFDRIAAETIFGDNERPRPADSDVPPTEPPIENNPPTTFETPPSAEEVPAPSELKLVMIDQSKDAKDFARDAANARLTEELNEGSWGRRFLKGIWKGNMAKEYFLSRYTREAERQIAGTQDVLVHEESAEGRRAAAMRATIERFMHESDDIMIHRAAGETHEIQKEDSPLTLKMKEFVKICVEGDLDDKAVDEEHKRAIEEYIEVHGTGALGEGLVRINNAKDIIKATRGAVEHGESLDNVIANMQIITGEARTGVRTEAHRSAIERGMQFLQESRVGSLVPDGVLDVAAAGLSFIGRIGSSKTLGAIFSPLAGGLPILSAMILGGVREGARVKSERTQHAREMAMGKEFGQPSAPTTRRGKILAKIFGNRREKMEQGRYETIAAQDMIGDLHEKHASILLEDSERPAGTTKDDALRQALDSLAEVEVRNRLSDTLTEKGLRRDFISYSDTASIGEERLQLALARAELKVLLSQELDDTTRTRLGLEAQSTVDDLLNSQGKAFETTIEADVSAKDKAFRSMRLRRVATMAGIAAVSGLVAGLAAQEAVASFDGTRAGFVEQAWGGDNHVYSDGLQHQTVLEGLINGDRVGEHVAPSTVFTPNHVGDAGNWQLSNDHNLVDNHDGTVSLVAQNGTVTVDHLQVNPDGSMPQSSIDTLHSKGMDVQPMSTTTPGEVHMDSRPVTLTEYVQNHQADTTHMARDVWYDNNTLRPDKNELRLHWTGTGVVPTDGSYHLNIASMTAGGSTHGGHGVNWAEQAHNGKLKLAVSPSGNFQTTPFMVDINPDGTINIPADHPAAAFFAQKDGHAVFTGRYAEVVQLGNVDTDGVQHVNVLSTLVGNGEASHAPLIDKVPVRGPDIVHPGYKITTNGFETPGTFTEMAPVVPVVSRRPLERLRQREYEMRRSYYGNYISPELIAAMRDETSPRLLNDPDQRLNPKEELTWYKNLVRKLQGNQYVNEIESLIAASPELSNISSDLKTIIKIPVNAAGDAESANIYNVLTKAYAEQDPDILKEAMILLHVNWFDDLMADPAKRVVIEHTRSEIERAKADFPQLKIATIESEWKRAEVSDGVIGHVSRRLNDTALFAIENAMQRGVLSDDQDILLIRNDADPKGISRNYLKRYIDEVEKHPDTDIFAGTTSFDNTKADTLPGFVFAGNFWIGLETLSITRDDGVRTGGANFGVRASTLAAVGAGGFSDYNGAASDDVIIGQRIRAARTPASISSVRSVGGYNRQHTGGYRAAASTPNERKIGRLVVGARIDTDSDREERLYRAGIPIVRTWSPEYGFDSNGYKDRNAGLGQRNPEDILTDTDAVIERVRNDIEGSINDVAPSSGVMHTALTLAFGSADAYEVENRVLGDGSLRRILHLKSKGKRFLVNHLTKDARGRPDSYGVRKLRQMYGEAGGSKQPTHRSMIRV